MTVRGVRRHRPAWWPELLLIGLTYGAYTLTRNTLPDHVTRARANAMDILRAERWLHLDVEHAVNAVVAAPGRHLLAVVANYTYSLAHFTVTIGVLAWIYVAHPSRYTGARTVLLFTTLLGLLGFWLYPLAPPRFFPGLGFVDTVVRDATWGSWGSGAVTSMSNQYAAMPSIHVAWSVWSAANVALWARRRWVRRVAPLYPLLVVLVIVGTANHWVLDAAGGLLALLLGAAGWLLLDRTLRRAGRNAPGAVADTVTPAPPPRSPRSPGLRSPAPDRRASRSPPR